MNLFRWIAGLAGLVILVPVVGIAIFMATFDANKLKTDITAQISAKTGRHVAIKGDVGLSLADGLAVKMKGVEIGSPAGFASQEFISIGDLQAAINWRALVRREIDVKSISLADAKINLQTNGAGQNNWEFKTSARAPDLDEAKLILASADVSDKEVIDTAKQEISKVMKGEKLEFNIQRVALNSLTLKNTDITQSDARTGNKQNVFFADADFKLPLTGAFKADAKGKYNGAAFDVVMLAEKGITALMEGKPTPIDLNAKYMGEAYAVKGMFARGANSFELNNLEATLKGMVWQGNLTVATGGNKPALKGNLKTTEVNLPALAPKNTKAAFAPQAGKPKAILIVASKSAAPDLSFLKMLNAELGLSIGRLIVNPDMAFDKVATDLTINDGALRLGNLTALMAGKKIDGDVRVTDAGKPMLSGNLTFEELNLPALSKKTAGLAPKAGMINGPNVILASTAAPAPDLSALNMLNADLALAFGRLILNPQMTLDKVSTRAKINNGRLSLNDLVFQLLGTAYKGSIDLDGNNAKTRVVLNAANVDFPNLAKTFGSKMPLSSKGDMAVDLTMNGFDPDAMMRNLGGKIEVVLGAGTLDMGGADQMAVGLAKFLFPKGAVQNNPKIDCAAMRFNASNGILNTNGMVVDSNVATVGGDGIINLAEGTINLTLKPVPKALQGSDLFVTPIRISGRTDKPNFAPQEEAIIGKAKAILTGNREPINTGVPKVVQAANNNGCLVALNNPQMIMITPPTAKEALGQVKDQAKEVINLGREVFKSGRDATKGDQGRQEEVIDKINQLKGLFGQ